MNLGSTSACGSQKRTESDLIERRCRERAKNAEKYYWKLGSTPKREIVWTDAFDEIRSGVVNGNENTKLNTIQRLKAVLEEIKQDEISVPTGKTAFVQFLIDKSKEIFDVGFSKSTLKQPTYKTLWLPVLTLVIESSIAVAPVEAIAKQPTIETPVKEVAVEETVNETQLEAAEIVMPQTEKEEPQPALDVEPKNTQQRDYSSGNKVRESRAQNPVIPSGYTPLSETTKSESPETIQGEELHTLPYMKVFEADSKNQKPLLVDLGQQERSLKTIRSQSKPKPILKPRNPQKLASIDLNEQRLQQRHSEIKRLESERKTLEYQQAARMAFERVRAILARAGAKSGRRIPSPPP